jgi:carbon-monoxide dehydrogenase large subunit
MNGDQANENESDGLVGSSVERREDPALLTGKACYTDDIQVSREVHLAILRSEHAHASIENVDTSAAERTEGVLAVYTRDDLVDAGLDGTIPGSHVGVDVDRPLLAGDKVRYQGDPIAGVVATDRYTARNVLDSITVDYDPLDATTDVKDAISDDAPSIHDETVNNIAGRWEGGDAEATERALEEAAHTVEVDLSINKVDAAPMEPRSALARYRGSVDELTVELSAQDAHAVQDDLSTILGIPEHRITVRTPEVGGGFGVKNQSYTGHVLAAWCAIQLERPVKWVATRTESFQSTNHGRRHDITAEAGLDEDGRLTALQVHSLVDVGAYLTQGGALIPISGFGSKLTGAYDVSAANVKLTLAFTNTTTLSAYRGAGRPEANYVIERLVDACARELEMDPVTFRRRNFISPDQFPYDTPLSATYDSGEYEKPLDKALSLIDYEEFRDRQKAARDEGRYLGIGLSTYVDVCGGGPGSLESGLVRMTPDGKVVAHTGTVDNGQGHRTSYAQIVADALGVPSDDVKVVEGDTDRVPEGGGTNGSRSMPMGGNALKASAEAVRENARQIAAGHFDVEVADVELVDGAFRVVDTPDRSIAIQEITDVAYSAAVPEELRGLEETTFFSPEGTTAPFGTHVAIVEVAPETGEIAFERYVAVDDVGTQINPKLVEGQIVGGVVQSLGQVLSESVEYDDSGNLVTDSLQDYAAPRARDVPTIECHSTVTPSPNNPLGVKGAGEAGTIAAMPAVVNAVIDALSPFGVEDLDIPLTDETVWEAVRAASDS